MLFTFGEVNEKLVIYDVIHTHLTITVINSCCILKQTNLIVP